MGRLSTCCLVLLTILAILIITPAILLTASPIAFTFCFLIPLYLFLSVLPVILITFAVVFAILTAAWCVAFVFGS